MMFCGTPKGALKYRVEVNICVMSGRLHYVTSFFVILKTYANQNEER